MSGSRKLLVAVLGIVCITVLALCAKLSNDAALGITGIVCTYLGVHGIADSRLSRWYGAPSVSIAATTSTAAPVAS